MTYVVFGGFLLMTIAQNTPITYVIFGVPCYNYSAVYPKPYSNY